MFFLPFFFFSILRRIRKNKALAHHTLPRIFIRVVCHSALFFMPRCVVTFTLACLYTWGWLYRVGRKGDRALKCCACVFVCVFSWGVFGKRCFCMSYIV